jgi:hypothetical protein
MNTTDIPHEITVGQLADQAAQAVRLLNHRTLPTTTDLWPADADEIIAALARMASMLPQLLSQLADRLQHQQHHGRLRVDALAPLPDPGQTVHALTGSLHHAIQSVQNAAAQLDTAHQHAAHLAAAEPAINDQTRPPHSRGQNSCRSTGPDHLTKRIHGNLASYAVDPGLGIAAMTAIANVLTFQSKIAAL